jgi:hypothetical protein
MISLPRVDVIFVFVFLVIRNPVSVLCAKPGKGHHGSAFRRAGAPRSASSQSRFGRWSSFQLDLLPTRGRLHLALRPVSSVHPSHVTAPHAVSRLEFACDAALVRALEAGGESGRRGHRVLEPDRGEARVLRVLETLPLRWPTKFASQRCAHNRLQLRMLRVEGRRTEPVDDHAP